MAEQVEVLEHHAHANALSAQIFRRGFTQAPLVKINPSGWSSSVINPLSYFFKQGNAAQDGALAGTGRTYQAQHFALVHRQVYAFQDFEARVVLSKAHDMQDGLRPFGFRNDQ